MNRREFMASVAVSAGGLLPAQPERPVPTVYFADGWHGGVYGHMPMGAWRDILRFLEQTPDWKVCLEIEPMSWDPLRRRDPEVYEELKRFLSDRRVDARVEMLGGSYGQPLAWAFSGESNIRHLTRAREILREHFPGVAVDTYAVQEPCWTSAMPQVLRSMGFVRAVLKNSTTTVGYTTGFDADLVEWIGPDGSSLPAVPRYACENLVHPHKLESCLQRSSAERHAFSGPGLGGEESRYGR
jgi:alpha-mannosidase